MFHVKHSSECETPYGFRASQGDGDAGLGEVPGFFSFPAAFSVILSGGCRGRKIPSARFSDVSRETSAASHFEQISGFGNRGGLF
jgi:hypothetical protein